MQGVIIRRPRSDDLKMDTSSSDDENGENAQSEQSITA